MLSRCFPMNRLRGMLARANAVFQHLRGFSYAFFTSAGEDILRKIFRYILSADESASADNNTIRQSPLHALYKSTAAASTSTPATAATPAVTTQTRTYSTAINANSLRMSPNSLLLFYRAASRQKNLQTSPESVVARLT